MTFTKETFNAAWDFLKGKKTYIIAIAGLIWGLYNGSEEVIITALGLFGVRHGVSSEIARLIKK